MTRPEDRLPGDDDDGCGGQKENSCAEPPEPPLIAQRQDVGPDIVRKYPVGYRLPGQAERVDGYLPGHVRHQLVAQFARMPGAPPACDSALVVLAQLAGCRLHDLGPAVLEGVPDRQVALGVHPRDRHTLLLGVADDFRGPASAPGLLAVPHGDERITAIQAASASSATSRSAPSASAVTTTRASPALDATGTIARS